MTTSNNIAQYAKTDLLEAIESAHEHFNRLAYQSKTLHYLTRRLTSLASFMILFGLLTSTASLADKMAVHHIISLDTWQFYYQFDIHYFDMLVLGFSSLSILLSRILARVKNITELSTLKAQVDIGKHYSNRLIWAFSLSLLPGFFIFSLGEYADHLLFWGIFIFVGAYSSNRKYGYTRAFSRNRLYTVKIRLLYSEKALELDVDDNIRQKLHELINEASIQTHKDIVGDYIAYGNSALKWLSSKKLK